MEIKTIKVGALPSPNSSMRLCTQIKHVEFISTCCDEQLAKQNLQNILNGVCNDVLWITQTRSAAITHLLFLLFFWLFYFMLSFIRLFLCIVVCSGCTIDLFLYIFVKIIVQPKTQWVGIVCDEWLNIYNPIPMKLGRCGERNTRNAVI